MSQVTACRLLVAAAMAAANGTPVCQQGLDYNAASDLNGGPTMLASPGSEQCRAMCEDHELCGAFVYRGREHGCLPLNENTATHHTNLPPTWPAAQCFLKAVNASATKLTPDNCTCAGLPRPACGTGAQPAACSAACPVSKLTRSSGVTCGRRRGFSLAGGPIASPSALDCEGQCSKRTDCVAWSWTSCSAGKSGKCSLKNLLGVAERDDLIGGVKLSAHETFSCTGAKAFPSPSRDTLAELGRNSTPFGYIQNPYHRVRHTSGNIRMHDRFSGVTQHPTGGIDHDPEAPVEGATIFTAVGDGTAAGVLLTAQDFDAAGLQRISPVHSKNRIAVAHGLGGARAGNVTTTYYQVSENVLGARVAITGQLQDQQLPPLQAAVTPVLYVITELNVGGKGKNQSFSAAYNTHDNRMLINGGPTPGYWGVDFGESAPTAVACTWSLAALRAYLSSHPGGAHEALDCGNLPPLEQGSPSLYIAASFPTTTTDAVTAGATPFTVLLARSTPSDCFGPHCAAADAASAVLDGLRVARSSEAENQWNRHVAEDSAFWATAIKLDGAWPASWQRGTQYDLNTVRANIRPATGVFTHPWDAMQVHGPRIVVAESSMDTMSLSYADVALAKDVLYGMYADTASRGQPQVPCQNEDGTTNMECMDNHTAGTPPSWGAPLFTIQSIYARDGDKAWAGKMYPLLKGYLNYWLINRTDAGGYQICMCTWESGQDMMKRWGWNQTYGGDRSSRIIRAPEHQAAMAHAAAVMQSLARSLGLGGSEEAYWEGVKERHVKLTMSLYNASARWFCDFNSRTNTWQSGCNDGGPGVGHEGAGKQTYQLAPLFFHSPAMGVDLLQGVDQSALASMIDAVSNPMKFGSDPPGSLTFAEYCTTTPLNARCVENIWAPHPFMTISAAGNANATLAASQTAKRLLNRVYGKMDARTRTHFTPTPSPFGRTTSAGSPYPGVSFECLSINYTRQDGVKIGPMAQSCGSEDYAWTSEATLVTLIREIVGFREHPLALLPQEQGGVEDSFVLRPVLPREWWLPGSDGAIDGRGSSTGPGTVYSVRDLQFRGTRFDLHYELLGPPLPVAAANDAATLTPEQQGLTHRISVRLEESAPAPPLRGEARGGRTSRRPILFELRSALEEATVRVGAAAFDVIVAALSVQ